MSIVDGTSWFVSSSCRVMKMMYLKMKMMMTMRQMLKVCVLPVSLFFTTWQCWTSRLASSPNPNSPSSIYKPAFLPSLNTRRQKLLQKFTIIQSFCVLAPTMVWGADLGFNIFVRRLWCFLSFSSAVSSQCLGDLSVTSWLPELASM